MERLYSKIVGMPVFVPDSMRPIYTVQEIVVDPENGKVIAFVVDSRRGLIVTAMDVVSVKHGVLIRGRDDVIEAEDVLRVQKVQEIGGFMGKKVETESGKRLGKVVDMTIDERGLTLNKIYTAKVVLGMIQHDGRIIAAKNIVEVKKNRVIVKDDSGEVKAKAKEREAELVGA